MLKLHPKVYAAFVAVALVGLTAANNALNGAQSWKEAGVQTASAFFVASIAYMKAAAPAPSAPTGGSVNVSITGDASKLEAALADAAKKLDQV